MNKIEAKLGPASIISERLRARFDRPFRVDYMHYESRGDVIRVQELRDMNLMKISEKEFEWCSDYFDRLTERVKDRMNNDLFDNRNVKDQGNDYHAKEEKFIRELRERDSGLSFR